MQPCGVRDAPGVGRVFRAIDAGECRQRRQGLPLGVVADGQIDVAVTRRVNADRREELVTASTTHDRLAEALDRERRDEPRDGAAKHGHVDPRALARLRAAVERLHHLAIGVLGSAEIHHGRAERRRWAVGLAGQRHEPGPRLQHRIVGGLVVVGAEAADAEPDQIAAHRAQRRLVDAQRRVGARTLVGGQHVHGQASHEIVQQRAALGRREVQGDGLLAAVVGQKVRAHGRLAEDVAPDEAVGIGPLRVLHADHARAVADQSIREKRQRRRLLEREHRQPLEGAGHSFWGPRNGPQTPSARTRPGGAVARLGVVTRCLIAAVSRASSRRPART